MDNRSRIRRILWGTLRGTLLPQRALELMLRWEDAYSDLFDRDPIAVCTAFFRQEMSHTLTEIQCIDLAEELITILERHGGSLPQDPIVSVHRLRASKAHNLLSMPEAVVAIEDQRSGLSDISSRRPIDESAAETETFHVDMAVSRDAFVMDDMERPQKFGRARALHDTNEYPKIAPDGYDDPPWIGGEATPGNSNLSIPTVPRLAQEVPGNQASNELPVRLRPFSNARAQHGARGMVPNRVAPEQQLRRSEPPKEVETDPFYCLDRSTFARIFLEHE